MTGGWLSFAGVVLVSPPAFSDAGEAAGAPSVPPTTVAAPAAADAASIASTCERVRQVWPFASFTQNSDDAMSEEVSDAVLCVGEPGDEVGFEDSGD
jgi:hypothetical protein